MSSTLDICLKQLDAQDAQRLILESSLNGIEKENLRVLANGLLAQTPHPLTLGSSLTHPYITTDYAESLLEIVTPPLNNPATLLSWLDTTYRYIYPRLDGELLWAPSMPCSIASPDDVPIAQYGPSHIGRLQTLYRVGLGHRYEKKMQTIAGIHFNYSLSQSFWQIWHDLYAPKNNTLQTTIDEGYFALLRNFLRYGWLIDYLFGASSAIDHSFLSGRHNPALQTYKQQTLYAPYACSLRMSGLGYHNATQKQLNVSFNSLQEYINGLQHAVHTHYPPYQAIFEKFGKDAQISANLLQTEAEYYAPVRPKRVALTGERQSLALRRAGVEYLEVRTFDINPYEPLGINLFQMYFTEIFLLYCLLTDSPALSKESHQAASANIQTVVMYGRKPGCELNDLKTQKPVPLTQWAESIFQDLYKIADFMDTHTDDRRYHLALNQCFERLNHPELLPSAYMLEDLFKHDDSFAELGLRLSKRTQEHFMKRPLSDMQLAELKQQTQDSLQEQILLEAQQTGSFEDFVEKYFKE